uniref:Zinc finger RAD18 domain-containing protein n=1 Tax=Ascaris suum TaxID=6253 RepID=F1L939_ASCSU
MRRINAIAGTNITIYHSFHAEVANYRQHWWRCDGPCRNRRPFYGFVKRATNRAPGSNDYWWEWHQATCGGKFVKVKEPEGYVNDKGKNVGLKQKARSASSGANAKCAYPSKTGQRTITDFFTATGYVLGGDKPTHPSTVHGTSPTLAAALRRQKENLSKAALSSGPKSTSCKEEHPYELFAKGSDRRPSVARSCRNNKTIACSSDKLLTYYISDDAVVIVALRCMNFLEIPWEGGWSGI